MKGGATKFECLSGAAREITPTVTPLSTVARMTGWHSVHLCALLGIISNPKDKIRVM